MTSHIMTDWKFNSHTKEKFAKLSLHFDDSCFKFKACEELVSTEISPLHQRPRTSQFELNTFSEDANSVSVEKEWCLVKGILLFPSDFFSLTFGSSPCITLEEPWHTGISDRKKNHPSICSSRGSFMLLMVQDWTNLFSLTLPCSVNWVQMIWRSLSQSGIALMNIWSA